MMRSAGSGATSWSTSARTTQPDPNRSLAEKWEASADGLTWTFTLRQGVKFHNGEELKAKDVKFTFDRLRDPKVGAATVALYSNITDITTPDDYTVVFTLAKPNPDFLLDIWATTMR